MLFFCGTISMVVTASLIFHQVFIKFVSPLLYLTVSTCLGGLSTCWEYCKSYRNMLSCKCCQIELPPLAVKFEVLSSTPWHCWGMCYSMIVHTQLVDQIRICQLHWGSIVLLVLYLLLDSYKQKFQPDFTSEFKY